MELVCPSKKRRMVREDGSGQMGMMRARRSQDWGRRKDRRELPLNMFFTCWNVLIWWYTLACQHSPKKMNFWSEWDHSLVQLWGLLFVNSWKDKLPCLGINARMFTAPVALFHLIFDQVPRQPLVTNRYLCHVFRWGVGRRRVTLSAAARPFTVSGSQQLLTCHAPPIPFL